MQSACLCLDPDTASSLNSSWCLRDAIHDELDVHPDRIQDVSEFCTANTEHTRSRFLNRLLKSFTLPWAQESAFCAQSVRSSLGLYAPRMGLADFSAVW